MNPSVKLPVKLLGLFAGAVATCGTLAAGAGPASASTAPRAAAPKGTALPRRGHGHAVAPRGAPRRAPAKAPAKAKSPYAGVDRQSPLSVGAAFIRASFTYDTATQASPGPATVRSAIWCTPSLRARVLASLPQGSPGAQWARWAAHKATTTVAVHWAPEPGAPAETTRTAYESYDVAVSAHGEHGWTGTPNYYVVWLTFSRTGAKAPWEVAGFEVQPWLGPKGYK